ncbi:MAG: SAM-dependent DNA methyltransferase, partial [Gordonia sp. (in: high G+C Gram-positive bacteria)]
TLRATKPTEHQGKVLFINAVNEVAREQAQSFLRESHQHRILDAYRAFEPQDGFAAVATLDQIAEKGHSLAIPQYVAGDKLADAGEPVEVAAALDAWRGSADTTNAAVADVLAILNTEVSS